MESLQLELCLDFWPSNFGPHSVVSVHLSICQGDLSWALGSSTTMLFLILINLLQVGLRLLSKFVLHDAIDRGLWAQSTAVGELTVWKRVHLVAFLLRAKFQVVTCSLSSISLCERKRELEVDGSCSISGTGEDYLQQRL